MSMHFVECLIIRGGWFTWTIPPATARNQTWQLIETYCLSATARFPVPGQLFSARWLKIVISLKKIVISADNANFCEFCQKKTHVFRKGMSCFQIMWKRRTFPKGRISRFSKWFTKCQRETHKFAKCSRKNKHVQKKDVIFVNSAKKTHDS